MALSIVTFGYGLSFFVFVLFFLVRKKAINAIADGIVITSFIIHLAAMIIRWYDSYQLGWGHAPLSNFYESLIFFSFAITLAYLFFRYASRLTFLGPFIMPLAFLTLAYASLSPDIDRGIRPLVPALQSNWLTAHVVTCFLSYAAFTFSFVVAVLHLIQNRMKTRRLPSPEILDELVHRGIVVGMPLLTMGIITGSVWAHYAWGSYWSWDPKETWSLITWIIYAAFLHVRLIRGWRGRLTSLFSIFGFLSVLFTFFGVNFIISGLHSYL